LLEPTSNSGQISVLSIRNLVKVYPGPVAALQGVSLDLPNGMFGLLGPNGAGKTTLMRILSGLLEPTSGQVLLDGQDVLNNPQQLWKQLGYLPQDFGFYPHLTGEKMLAYLLQLKGVQAPQGIKALCGELLERVNLTFAAKRKVKGYSGGMRQRLGLAQAIAGNPRLIIVDEPTAGLDPAERNRFLNLLASIGREVTVILSTHIVDDVRELCSRMAIIASGEVLLEGVPAETLAALEGQIWSRIVATDDELRSIESEFQVISTHLAAGQHEIRVFAESSPGAGFHAVPSGLEDVYFFHLARHAKN
jgi:ABC-2 type transport system ATP-binding protein